MILKYISIALISLFICNTSYTQSFLPCLQQSEYQSNWQCIGPFNAPNQTMHQHFGAINAISVNPDNENEIFVGAYSAGLFHTINKGKSWECMTDNFIYPVIGVNAIWIDYSKKPYTILLATGCKTVCDGADFGILKSTDGGLHWSNHYKEEPDLFVSTIFKKIQYDKVNHVFYATGNQVIIRSFDEGNHWEPIFSLKQIPSVIAKKDFEINSLIISDDGQALYFTTKANVEIDPLTNKPLIESDLIKIQHPYKILDNIRYEKMTSQITEIEQDDQKTLALKVIKTADHQLIIDRTFVGTRLRKIYTYDIASQQVTAITTPNYKSLQADIYWRAGLIVNPTNRKYMYLAGNILYRSTDSGHTFKPLYDYSFGENNIPHADIRSINIYHFSEDGLNDIIYLGTDGGLSYSNNSGKSFVNLNGESLPITQFYGLGISPFTGTISAGSQDNSIMSYLPKTREWIIAITGDGYDVEYNKRIPNEAYGQYNARIMMKTTNDIAPFNVWMNINEKERAYNKKTLATDLNGNLYFAEDHFNILRKGATSWETTRFDEAHEALAFAVSCSDTSVIYLSKCWHSLYKSTDGGKTFKNISDQVLIDGHLKSNTRIHAICIAPDNPNKVWISLGYLGDYKDPCKQTNRVLLSEDGGITWSDYSMGLPVYNVSDIVFLEGTKEALFASTIEGIFFRENSQEPWKLFSTHLPKCIIPEMQISYCRGKLIAATYGRGLWETDLPDVKYNAPKIIKGNISWEVEDNEALYMTSDIELNKKAILTINAPVHIAKGKTIWVKNKNQIVMGKKGKLLNECGESWNGIKIKK
ncbi:MAG: hypothetical protein IPH46_06405 [Bacteroidetes bacterium]|nr:hypothetical protein [Bacteroidota bacterium]